MEYLANISLLISLYKQSSRSLAHLSYYQIWSASEGRVETEWTIFSPKILDFINEIPCFVYIELKCWAI
jgi:hypothetical protein